jgi:hypothetical protein
MKVIFASVGASMLVACGGESGAEATLYVDPPTSGNCLGVAGFEVIVTPAGKPAHTEHLITPATILDPKVCALPQRFSLPDLDVNASVGVTVRGYDGSGTALRVAGVQSLPNLREGPVRLALKAAEPLPPLLVFRRNPLLENATLSEVTSMAIVKQMGQDTLLTVDRSSTGYFDPEPGAYGIAGLDPNGAAKGTAIFVKFTVPGRTIKEGRVTLDWNGTYYTAQ